MRPLHRSAAACCRRVPVCQLVLEIAVGRDTDEDLVDRRTVSETAQYLRRQLGKQAPRQDALDIACAALAFLAALGNQLDQCGIVAAFNLVILGDATADALELE